jgi:class 3 adenylate cyclase
MSANASPAGPREVRPFVVVGPDHVPSGIPIRRTERKIATVLFTDVESSTKLLSSIELEQW